MDVDDSVVENSPELYVETGNKSQTNIDSQCEGYIQKSRLELC